MFEEFFLILLQIKFYFPYVATDLDYTIIPLFMNRRNYQRRRFKKNQVSEKPSYAKPLSLKYAN